VALGTTFAFASANAQAPQCNFDPDRLLPIELAINLHLEKSASKNAIEYVDIHGLRLGNSSKFGALIDSAFSKVVACLRGPSQRI
jgi:hypothetical protein